MVRAPCCHDCLLRVAPSVAEITSTPDSNSVSRLFLIRRDAFAGFDRAYSTRNDVWRTGKDPIDQLLDLLAPQECGFEILLLGVGEKFGVLHHGFEGLAKHRHALLRGTGWCHDRIGHVLAR